MTLYQECPRFNTCNVNKCPLDPEIDLRNSVKSDEKCTMEKEVRFRIGKTHPNLLPHQGLNNREWAGRKNWNELSPQKRELRLEALYKMKKIVKFNSGKG